jgi:microsomal dipeptidase-like Zn-dependent dipeptidase
MRAMTRNATSSTSLQDIRIVRSSRPTTLCARSANAGLNLSVDTIRRIQQSNGTIGVIFYRHWLRRLDGQNDRDDIQLITDVIDYIHRVTSSYENVSIGSDLDGFMDPIELCSNYTKMSRIAIALVAKYGQSIAEKILFRNALRVLHAGWSGVPTLARVSVRN